MNCNNNLGLNANSCNDGLRHIEQIALNKAGIDCLDGRVSRTEVDIKDRYTKTELDRMLACKLDRCGHDRPDCNGKPNICDYYTKEELDQLLSEITCKCDTYSKEELDDLLDKIACTCDCYSKAEVDGLLENKVQKEDIENIQNMFDSVSTLNLDVTAKYEAGRFIITGVPSDVAEIFSIRFVTPARFSEGDMLNINDQDFYMVTASMVPLLHGVFEQGAVVCIDIRKETGMAFFRMGGGSNELLLPPEPPESFSFLTALTDSQAFIVPKTGWYKIFAFGKSQNGYNSSHGGTAPGGASGGFAASQLYLRKDTLVPITINPAISSFGEYLYATCPDSWIAPGKAYGGNIVNLEGYPGGAGGTTVTGSKGTAGSQGGNNGMLGGTGGANTNASYRAGGGGGGGARLPGSDYCRYIATDMHTLRAGTGGGSGSSYNGQPAQALPAVVAGPTMLLYGGAGGFGGAGYGPGGSGKSEAAWGYYSYAQLGTGNNIATPGIIIIEKGDE